MMRKIIWFFAAMFLVGACHKKEVLQLSSGPFNQEWELNVNEKIEIKDNKELAGATITFLNLNDSRCPANAMCIRQGAAITTFEITTPNPKETIKVRLFIGDFMPNDPRNKRNQTADTANLNLGTNPTQKYELILKQVLPYPGTSTEPPKATLVLKSK